MAIPLPKELFHGTRREYLDSIMKEGIIPNKNKKWEMSKNKVYLGDRKMAEAFSSDSDSDDLEPIQERVLLKINVNKLQKDKIAVDSNCYFSDGHNIDSWEYDGIIPPEAIEEVIDVTF